MKPPKGEARLAVEEAMSRATRENPLSAQQIAEIAGVAITVARTHIGTCVNKRLAHNLHPARKGAGLYAWGATPQPAEVLPPNMPGPRFIPTERLDWKPSEPARAGANNAFDIPSLGDTVRKRPIIIGARQMAYGGRPV